MEDKTQEQNITPINSNITPITNDEIINNQSGIDQKQQPKQELDDFIKSLPNWDLTPPYETVRRVTRI